MEHKKDKIQSIIIITLAWLLAFALVYVVLQKLTMLMR